MFEKEIFKHSQWAGSGSVTNQEKKSMLSYEG